MRPRIIEPSATRQHLRMRKLIHDRFGSDGHVPAADRQWLRTWPEVWAALNVTPPRRPPCFGKLHGWLLPAQSCAVVRGQHGRTFWVRAKEEESLEAFRQRGRRELDWERWSE